MHVVQRNQWALFILFIDPDYIEQQRVASQSKGSSHYVQHDEKKPHCNERFSMKFKKDIDEVRI